ncbi:MAG: cadmium-translocating P-type ATPase [Candidatus Thorarchaeota archaeon]|nr:MAG: cadmium-translocating P-type ATPase [Candidatus Thorarchaeota archaeon]RLI57107.1 MAG: cadmium-translocating P-type ATPase [Candidatus Thorarchaeota archaeon]
MSQELSTCTVCGLEEEHTEPEHRTISKPKVAIFSGIMLGLGLIIEFLGLGVLWAYIAFLSSMLSAGAFIIPKGIRGMLKLRLDMHFLMAVASIGAMLIGAPAEGAAVMFLFFISMILEDRAGDKVREEIRGLMELEPPTVMLRTEHGEIPVQPSEVEVGQTIIIRPGDRIGLDGVITEGGTSVNEAPITGESRPVDKSIGDSVFAGSVNNEGYVEVEVTAKSTETVLSRIITLIDESRKNKAPTERLISRFSRVYTPIMLAIAILLGWVDLALGATMVQAVYRSLTIIVISCPCAFAVSIPVSIVSAITGAARNGVLVKGGAYIEAMGKIDIVALDKTGTLTEGMLSVKDICLHNGYSESEILRPAASIETRSEHPIAKALVQAQHRKQLSEADVESFEAVPGRGVRGQIGHAEYLIGNRQFLVQEEVGLQDLADHSCGVGTMVYVAKDGEHMGTIVLADTVRDSTREAIRDLREMGVRTVILTGDSENVAQEVAKAIGVDEYRAELLPHEKVDAVNELKKEGHVLFVGDGINDGPAIATADVGMALSAVSSDVALESADVALMEQDLRKIPQLLRRARQTMSVVKQNVATSITLKTLTGMLAAAGIITLWVSIAVGDMGLTFLVIANALRLARKQ